MENHSLQQYFKPYSAEIFIESNTINDPINDKIYRRPARSFVWDYFRPLDDSYGKSLKCIICDSKVSKRTSNLARHLFAAHDITRNSNQRVKEEFASNCNNGRENRSFIWKYCTKEDSRYSRCHLCDRLLYSGSGNTANISNHLQSKHSEVIAHDLTDMDESEELIGIISSNQMESTVCGEEEVTQCEVTVPNKQNITTVKHEAQQQSGDLSDSTQIRRDRRSSSYVWNYCIKLSRNEIRCKLCRKVMSFHGTANVITHLQRRHNIIGGVAHDNTAVFQVNEEKVATMKSESYTTAFRHRRRRSAANKSEVWTYYTRLSQDVVRCNICQKNLSFQGTSNCQRHLHRMHGIVTQGRSIGGMKRQTIDYGNLIREYCEHIEDNRIKCTMCSCTFAANQSDEVRKHLTVTHSILPKPPAKRCKRRRRLIEDTSEESDDGDYDNEDENCEGENTEYNMDFSGTDIKKDIPSFDDIIEEDIAEENYCDEDPFDPTRLQDYPEAKLLSVTSSRDGSPEPTAKPSIDTSRLRSLNEERMRMETQYFREKAGYYRMQKYHTALQARKAKIELQRLQSSGLNGTAYSGNVDISDANGPTATLFENHKE